MSKTETLDEMIKRASKEFPDGLGKYVDVSAIRKWIEETDSPLSVREVIDLITNPNTQTQY